MRDERLAERAWRLRASLLWLVFLGIVGLAIVLAYERHWDGYWQLVPWATLGIVFLALLALLLFPSSVTKKLAQIVAVVTILAAGLGLWQHFDTNYESAAQDAAYSARWEDMGLLERVWEVGRGSVGDVPIYAAAALIPLALAMAMATIGLGQEEDIQEYVDPRQRR